MIKSPCKDCQNRRLLCHSSCLEYLEYFKSNEELKKKRFQETEKDYFAITRHRELKDKWIKRKARGLV